MYKEIDIDIAGKVMEVDVTGKFTKEDYARFVPATEALLKEQGKIRILFVMHDFHGWSAGAIWEDIKFDLKHFAHIERLAIVGERKWNTAWKSFAGLSRPRKCIISMLPSSTRRANGSMNSRP